MPGTEPEGIPISHNQAENTETQPGFYHYQRLGARFKGSPAIMGKECGRVEKNVVGETAGGIPDSQPGGPIQKENEITRLAAQNTRRPNSESGP
jgi:hypothetical protein